MDERTVTLRAYSNIWKIQKRLEHLNGVRVNSIPIEHALYFIACAALEGFILLVIPPLRGLPILILLGMPFAVSTFLSKVKLDGKNPVKYLLSLIDYLTEPRRYLRFRPYQEDKHITLNGMIPFRRTILKKQ